MLNIEQVMNVVKSSSIEFHQWMMKTGNYNSTIPISDLFEVYVTERVEEEEKRMREKSQVVFVFSLDEDF